jgi:hypothetical protein
MVYAFLISTWFDQQYALDFNVPFWIWVLLSILLLAVILGLIIGEAMAKRDIRPPAQNRDPFPIQPGLIPQTGRENQPGQADAALDAQQSDPED